MNIAKRSITRDIFVQKYADAIKAREKRYLILIELVGNVLKPAEKGEMNAHKAGEENERGQP